MLEVNVYVKCVIAWETCQISSQDTNSEFKIANFVKPTIQTGWRADRTTKRKHCYNDYFSTYFLCNCICIANEKMVFVKWVLFKDSVLPQSTCLGNRTAYTSHQHPNQTCLNVIYLALFLFCLVRAQYDENQNEYELKQTQNVYFNSYFTSSLTVSMRWDRDRHMDFGCFFFVFAVYYLQ